MSIGICTLGMFNPSVGTGTSIRYIVDDGGGSGFDAKNYRKPKPIVLIRRVNSSIKQRKPKIRVIEVETL